MGAAASFLWIVIQLYEPQDADDEDVDEAVRSLIVSPRSVVSDVDTA